MSDHDGVGVKEKFKNDEQNSEERTGREIAPNVRGDSPRVMQENIVGDLEVDIGIVATDVGGVIEKFDDRRGCNEQKRKEGFCPGESERRRRYADSRGHNWSVQVYEPSAGNMSVICQGIVSKICIRSCRKRAAATGGDCSRRVNVRRGRCGL